MHFQPYLDAGVLTIRNVLDHSSSPASSILSDLPPPNKKRRLSSLSDSDDESEEDRPLAAVFAQNSSLPGEKTSRTSGKRSGKKGPGIKTKASTAPTSLAPPTGKEQALMNGTMKGVTSQKGRVKVEDRLDERQLDRLVTGVTVDTGGQSSAIVGTSSKLRTSSLTSLLSPLPSQRKQLLSSSARA